MDTVGKTVELFIQQLGLKTASRIQYSRNTNKKRGFTIKESDVIDGIHSNNMFSFLKSDFPNNIMIQGNEKKSKVSSSNSNNKRNTSNQFATAANSSINVYFNKS